MAATETDRLRVKHCIARAEEAAADGDHPFAAMLVLGDEILLEGRNTVVSTNDPTAHGEMSLLRRAFATLPSEKIAASTLYSSMEPCAMCAGAIYWAGIGRVVFGCSAERLAQLAGKRLTMSCRAVFATGTRAMEVEGPLLEAEAEKIHAGFWKPGQVKGPGIYGTM